MRRTILVLLGAVLLIASASIAHAQTTDSQLKINIYPLDCVFENINDGTNQVRFLTPEACGQEVIIVNPTPEVNEQAPIAIANPNITPAQGPPVPATPIDNNAPPQPLLLIPLVIALASLPAIPLPSMFFMIASIVGICLALLLYARFWHIVPRLWALLGSLYTRRK